MDSCTDTKIKSIQNIVINYKSSDFILAFSQMGQKKAQHQHGAATLLLINSRAGPADAKRCP